MEQSTAGSKREQSLPNECLLIIIQQFRYDNPGLLNLLTVNKFFFRETLKLLICDFLATSNSSRPRLTDSIAYRKLSMLFIRSLLLHQCLKRKREERCLQQQAYKGIPEASGGTEEGVGRSKQEPVGLMALERCDTVSPSEIPEMLKEFGLMNTTNSFNLLFDKSHDYYKETTFDYSIYHTRIESWKSGKFDLHGFLKPYSNIDSETIECAQPLVLDDIIDMELGTDRSPDAYNDESVASSIFVSFGCDVETKVGLLHQRIAQMFLHFNHDHIVRLGFFLHEAPLFVSFATKLPQLQSLCLNNCCHHILLVPDVSQVITFIQQNQDTFPSKPSLNLKFKNILTICAKIMFQRELIDKENWIELRRKSRDQTAPFIQMYETVRQPRMINVGGIPHFYERSDNIHVEALHQFSDTDSSRFISGEGPAMEDFLKRCHGLKSLDLVAGDPYMFQWAVPSPAAHQTTESLLLQPVQRPLERLERLTLWSDIEQPILVYTLNDAVLAFGKTLREICCRASKSMTIDLFHSMFDVDMSPKLERLSKALTLRLDWHLPNVRRIHIELFETFEFESFDGCPLLEELTLSESRQHQNTYGSSRERPSLEKDQRLMNVWRLPRLTKLSVSGNMVVRFNFESIRWMKQLRDLSLSTPIGSEDINFVDIYSGLFPLLLQQAYNTMKECIQGRNGIVNTESRAQDAIEPTEFLPWSWGSDSLTKLSLSGALAMALNLEQLKQFPSLRDLRYQSWSYDKYNLSNSKIEAMARIYLSQGIEIHQPESLDHLLQEREYLFTPLSERLASYQDVESNLLLFLSDKGNQDVANSRNYLIQPFVHSQLERLSFDTRWTCLTPETLVYLLTWIAPNLKSLRLRLSFGYATDEYARLYRLLKAIQAADQIVASRNTPKVATADPTIFDSNVDPRGDDLQGELVGESSQDQSDGSNNNSSEPTSHPINSGPRLKLSLTKVKIDVVLDREHQNELGLRQIRSSEADIFQNQGIRLYKLQGYNFVEISDLQNLL